MQEAIFCDRYEPHEQLPNERDGFLFSKFLPLLEKVLQIALIAKLSDYVAIVGSAEDVVAFEDIGMVEFLECLDFTLEHALLGLALDGPNVDYFDCHLFLGFVVGAAVNHRAETAPYDVL